MLSKEQNLTLLDSGAGVKVSDTTGDVKRSKVCPPKKIIIPHLFPA